MRLYSDLQGEKLGDCVVHRCVTSAAICSPTIADGGSRLLGLAGAMACLANSVGARLAALC